MRSKPLKEKIKMEKPLKELISQLYQKIIREIRFTLIAQLMRIREIFQRTLRRETL